MPLGLVSPAKLRARLCQSEVGSQPLTNFLDLLKLLELPPEYQSGLETALRDGIPNTVLNARYHYEESQIIAGAGAYGSVVIATNMAGRGVDIKLGSELAEQVLAAINRVLERAGITYPYTMTLAERRQALQKLSPVQSSDYQAEVDFFLGYMNGMERVKRLGGLHVIGSTHREARRIDNQLRGRAARQGDPGSSHFFVSMEDELMERFGRPRSGGVFGTRGPARRRPATAVPDRSRTASDRSGSKPGGKREFRNPPAPAGLRQCDQYPTSGDLCAAG